MAIYFPALEAIPMVMEEFPETPEGYVGLQEVFRLNTTDHTGFKIKYYVQDGVRGMTAAHALGTDPKIVAEQGWKEYEFDALPFKQTRVLNERQILTLADMKDDRQRMSVNKWVGEALKDEDEQANIRMEQSGWEVLSTGHLVINEDEIKFTQDYGIPSGNKLGVGTGISVAWSNAASAIPIDDVQGALALFDSLNVSKVRAYSNAGVARMLAKCEQFQDRLGGLANVLNLTTSKIAAQFADMTDLDEYKVYRRHYTNAAGVRVPMIPNNKLIIVGEQSTNGPTMEWASVPSLHRGTPDNPQAGKFAWADDSELHRKKNPRVEVTGGVYGGPVLYKSKLVLILTVA